MSETQRTREQLEQGQAFLNRAEQYEREGQHARLLALFRDAPHPAILTTPAEA